MNPNWRTEILPGVLVVTDHDDDKDVWRVIALHENRAWIRNIRTGQDIFDNPSFLFPTTRTS